MNSEDINDKARRIASQIIDASADKTKIYNFMDAHGIGKSDYGKYLDAIGRDKHLFYHRLEGHHPVFDLPFINPEKIPDFIEHVWVSDSATSQGLPILPNRFLEHTIVKDYIHKKTIEWNFINAFDLLSGTLAIYGGYKNCQKYFSNLDSIESFGKLASEIGIGIIELAIAFSKQNPLLFIGAMFQLIGSIKGVFNSSDVVYFNKINSQFCICIKDAEKELDDIISKDSLFFNDAEKELDDIVSLNDLE